MTTRTLLRILLIFLCIGVLSSCSIFKSTDDQVVSPDEVDQSSAALEDEDPEVAEGEEGEGEEDLTEDDLTEDDLAEEAASGELDEELADEDDSEDDDEGDIVGEELGDDDELEDDGEELADEEDLDDEGLDDFADEEDALGDDLDSESLDDIDDQLVAEELNEGGAAQDQLREEFVVDAEPMEEEAMDEQDLAMEEEVVDGAEEMAITASEASVPSNEVTNLEYKSFDSGGTVVIETSQPAQYQIREEPDLNQVIIEVDGVQLPNQFKRPYIAKDFKQDVATINAYQPQGGSTARFVIQMKRPVQPFVQQEGNSILVMTTKPAEQADMAVAMNEAPMSDGAPMDESMAPTAQPNYVEETPSNGNGLPEDSNTLSAIKFQGEKINLEVAGVDVREVIRTISEQSGVNLILDKDVEGEVNIRLREVPWDQALMVVLKSQGLGYKRQGNVLRIAKQSSLSSEAEAISKQIESEKRAKLLASGLKVKYIPVSYAKVEELQKKLASFVSKEGKVTFDARTSSIVVTDYGEYLDRISKLVKAMDTPPMQVEIEAKVVEAREEFSKEIGINWTAVGAIGEDGGSFNIASPPHSPSVGAFSMDLSLGTVSIFEDLTAALGLFERQNKIRVLSSPKIQTMNKQKAKIEQITQIPIQQITQNQGGNTITFTFKDLVLSLEVTPQITFKGDVILDVKIKREFAGAEIADGQREINTRLAETTVMVSNGQTAVIGGIYQNDTSDVNQGVPLLKDIPFIGALFRSKRKTKQKNELLVFLKPTVLKSLANSIARFNTGPSDIEDVALDSSGDDDFSVDESEYSDDGGAEEGFGDEESFEDDSGEEIKDSIEEEGLSDDLEEMAL